MNEKLPIQEPIFENIPTVKVFPEFSDWDAQDSMTQGSREQAKIITLESVCPMNSHENQYPFPACKASQRDHKHGEREKKNVNEGKDERGP